MTQYRVKFKKRYNKNIIISEPIIHLDFPSLESAEWYIDYLKKHSDVPVKTFDHSDYTCHNIELLKE